MQSASQNVLSFERPKDLRSDGGPEFSAARTSEFLKRWEVIHILSSAYFPQSNGRAEVAVRITKQLLKIMLDLMIASTAIIWWWRFCNWGIPQIENQTLVRQKSCLGASWVTPCLRWTNRFPSLRTSSHQWRDNWAEREKAIRTRMVKTCERLEQNSKDLPYLHQGDTVFIQNQDQSHGKPNKWDREGTIVEVGDNDQYLVRVHGTGRVTLRNRRFLRILHKSLDMISQ